MRLLEYEVYVGEYGRCSLHECISFGETQEPIVNRWLDQSIFLRSVHIISVEYVYTYLLR